MTVQFKGLLGLSARHLVLPHKAISPTLPEQPRGYHHRGECGSRAAAGGVGADEAGVSPG